MSALQETASNQQLFNQWWHLASNLALECPPETKQAWRSRIQQIIHYYRLVRHNTGPAEARPYTVMCQISLAQSRLDLSDLLLDGCITLPEMNKLYTLSQTLENSLAG